MAITPALSLVVCTRNRGKRLKPFFESLLGLRTKVAWELIMVNNASTDDTEERLQRFAEGFPGNVLILNEDKIGQGCARNAGWRKAKAQIIAYTDDDCYPRPDFLDRVLAAFDDKRFGFVGGRILLYDANDARVTIRESKQKQILVPPAYCRAGWVTGANMALRREALEEIGGFDGLFGPGAFYPAADESDAQARILAAGWHAKYDPEILVYHHHGRKPGADVAKLMRGYAISIGAYHAKTLLNQPSLRYIYLKGWLKLMIKNYPRKRTLLEIVAAINYFTMAYLKKC